MSKTQMTPLANITVMTFLFRKQLMTKTKNIKQELMEELDYRLNSALNYPISNEELGNFIPYNSTDECCREIETIEELVSKSIDKSISQAHQSGIEEERRRIIDYQNGFVQDDGAGEGNYLFAPEFEVIDDLLRHLKSLKENKQ